jgi:2-iminobutanoate/2-iminopropanoate deaminase
MTRSTIETGKAPVPKAGYSQATRAGDVLHVSGTLGLDPGTGKIVEGAVEDEVHQVFRNIRSVLEAAGSSLHDVVKTTVFVTDFSFYASFDAIYRTYFPAPFPARSTVQVAGLLAGASIEVEAIAVTTTA